MVTAPSAAVRAGLALGALLLSSNALTEVPRGADGKPDLNGIWQVLNRANFDIEPHAARAALAMVPGDLGPVPAPEVVALGAVGSVPGGAGVIDRDRLPYKPAARRQQRANQADWLARDPEIRCYLPGIPRANYMPYPFQIVHSDSAVFFSYEYAGAARNVYLEDPGEAPIDSWMGQSWGRWDGDSFVIEVTGQNDQTWFDRAGNHHSDQMTVTERFTRTGDLTMTYEARIDDPATFSEPWTMSMTLYRRVGRDAELQQFKCVEFVEELQYGHLRTGKVPVEEH